MRGQTLHAHRGQALRREEADERREREVTEMFVVNRVELAVVDHVAHVRRFHHHHAARRQQRVEAADNPGQIGHVRQHVVGMDNLGQQA